MLGTDIKKMSLKRVQKGGMYLIMFKALTSRPHYILLGGTIMVRCCVLDSPCRVNIIRLCR